MTNSVQLIICSIRLLCYVALTVNRLRVLWCLFVFFICSTSSCSDIDAPTNLVASEVTEDTVTVSWDRVHAEIEGYMLSYTTADGSSGEIPVGRDSTSYRLIGLKPGVLHTVYIWAFKGDRVSGKTSTEAETGNLSKEPWSIRGVTGAFYHLISHERDEPIAFGYVYF